MPTKRQEEILRRLRDGQAVREIAEDIGVSRNAVYQQIQTMRKRGQLPPNFTQTGQPPREIPRRGEDVLRRLVAFDDGDEIEAAGAAALVVELQRTRDELDAIVHRLSFITAA